MNKTKTKKIKRDKKIFNKVFIYKLLFLIIAISGTSSTYITCKYFSHAQKYEATVLESITKIEESIKTEEDIVKSYMLYAKHVYNPNYKIRREDILEKHTSAVDNIKSTFPEIEKYSKHHYYLAAISLGLLLMQLVLICYIIIKFIKRYSSPEKYISKLLDKVLKGEVPDKRSLRKRDELKDIHKKIIKLAGKKS